MTKKTLLPLLGFVLSLLVLPASAQTPGTCEVGTQTVHLDVNRVDAPLSNTGRIWDYIAGTHEVPTYSGASPIFAGTFWLAGKVDTEVRASATTYGNPELWPGPLGSDGSAPSDCSQYDRIWVVSQADLDAYEAGDTATTDLAEWPVELGAPVIDGDGIADNYDLAAGDRPDLLGHMDAFWVMNDVGNTHGNTSSNPIGLEVRIHAYAVATEDDAFNFSTFYRTEFHYKGTGTLEDFGAGFWVDFDLGDASDDFVGADTTRNLGYVYNADNDDAGLRGYGMNPPAAGVQVIGSPEVNGEELGLSAFIYYNNDQGVQGNPISAEDYFNYLNGQWKDGTDICFGGDGYDAACTDPTPLMFPGDPVTDGYWSEVNTDDAGSNNTPADRRALMATGPFTLNNGDVVEITYASVYARGESNLASITALRDAADALQMAFDANDGDFSALTFVAPPVPMGTVGVTGEDLYVVTGTDTTITVTVDIENTGTIPLDWDIFNDAPLIESFTVTANANGPIDPPAGAAPDYRGFPSIRPDATQQSNGSTWFVYTSGDYLTYEEFLDQVLSNGPEAVLPYDYEMRFVTTGMDSTTCIKRFEDDSLVRVPFQLWQAGTDTPDDPSDDVRLSCVIDETTGGTELGVYDIGGDSPASSLADDPIADGIYWYRPEDTTPGEAGYQADVAAMEAGTWTAGLEVMGRTALVNWNGGEAPPYNADLPEPGTIFRIDSGEIWTRLAEGSAFSGTLEPGASVQVEVVSSTYGLIRDTRTDTLTVLTNIVDADPTRFGITFIDEITVDTEDAATLPEGFALGQNYPNPFNPSTQIQYALPQAAEVRLAVFDLLGREVAVLLDATQTAGTHTVAFDASHLASGVYFYQLETPRGTLTQKMLLLK